MATIFQRPILPDEKFLVLEPKEALIVPFNVGEWNEVAVWVNLSFTSTGSDLNGNPIITSSDGITSGNNFFIGIKDNSDRVPWSGNGIPFLGSQLSHGNNFTPGTGTTMGTMPSFTPCVFYPGYSSGFVGVNDGFTRNFPGNFFMSGSATGYCVSMGMKFKVRDRNKSGQFVSVTNPVAPNPLVSPSLADLRRFVNFYDSSNLPYRASGFWTTNATSTGAVAELPNSFYFYCPLNRERARIHDLLIQRIS